MKNRKISFNCRNSNRRSSIQWLRPPTKHANPTLSVTVDVSSRSYLLPTTHTPAQHAHNHTPHPVIRGCLNAELSTGLHNGLPCRSPCVQCRPLYSEESHDNAGAPVSTAMQLQAVQPVCTDRRFLKVLEFHPLLVFRIEHNNPEAGSVFVVRRNGSQLCTFASAHRTLIRDVSTEASSVGKTYSQLSSLIETTSDSVQAGASYISSWRFCTLTLVQDVPRCDIP